MCFICPSLSSLATGSFQDALAKVCKGSASTNMSVSSQFMLGGVLSEKKIPLKQLLMLNMLFAKSIYGYTLLLIKEIQLSLFVVMLICKNNKCIAFFNKFGIEPFHAAYRTLYF